jgi:hypothetical protein
MVAILKGLQKKEKKGGIKGTRLELHKKEKN